jgi:spore germination protein
MRRKHMEKSLTNRQIVVMLYSIILGYGDVNVPKQVASASGTGSWFTLLMATVIFILISCMITYLQYVYEGKTLYEYSEILVGKSITNLFLVIYLIYFSVYFTMVVRIYSEVINLIILNKTPVIFICLISYIVIGYALSKGINVIARVCEIYVPINIFVIILINFLLVSKGKYVNIMPLFSTSDMMKYFKALQATILPFTGMELLLFIPISRTENKDIFKYIILLIGFIGILFIDVVESTISVVGVESVVFLKETVLSVLKGIDIYSLDIIRRLDGLYIVIWIMNLVCAMSLWSYGIITIVSRKVKNVKYNFMVIIIVCISFIVSQMPKTMDQVELILQYNSYSGVVMFFVIPAILFIITKVKKYDKQV